MTAGLEREDLGRQVGTTVVAGWPVAGVDNRMARAGRGRRCDELQRWL